MKKEHLPQKICAACGRPFTWRKKWERDWESVKFCSDGCRKNKKLVKTGHVQETC